MAINDHEATKQKLVDLNQQIGEMEQEQSAATGFLDDLLSDQLIFRRASGMVVGKSGPGGFLDSLKKPGPFTSRVPEEISVALIDQAVLCSLFVIGLLVIRSNKW